MVVRKTQAEHEEVPLFEIRSFISMQTEEDVIRT